ncbi:uncharacterized protein TRAVEDRAFT_32045 [Trametes versicolor FP-101664 SS1]|uniref:uncharacterized protein n=1 Tax=Trametes versicolor (strain FP-101664) TaxID=717944 RepID=UPI0004621BEC|nr:uncharacterized protein TRAVEDRAFT_32045 [Trametes versicolor FP-101664 SS1]EIW52257.1 hypothetical protein TRAVEDRAFT_32045 [Trametes versicolor FP-101664 SS1]
MPTSATSTPPPTRPFCSRIETNTPYLRLYSKEAPPIPSVPIYTLTYLSRAPILPPLSRTLTARVQCGMHPSVAEADATLFVCAASVPRACNPALEDGAYALRKEYD